MGLVNRALPVDEVLPAAIDYIRDLAIGSSPASMAAMKRQVWRDLNQTLGQAQDQAVELMKESFSRPDFSEGVKSFLERRPPNFPRYTAQLTSTHRRSRLHGGRPARRAARRAASRWAARQRGEDPLLVGEVHGDEVVGEAAAAGRQGHDPAAAVDVRRSAGHEALALEAVDALGGARRVVTSIAAASSPGLASCGGPCRRSAASRSKSPLANPAAANGGRSWSSMRLRQAVDAADHEHRGGVEVGTDAPASGGRSPATQSPRRFDHLPRKVI